MVTTHFTWLFNIFLFSPVQSQGLVDPKVKLTQLASQKQKLEHKLSKLMAQTQTQASNYQEKASQATQAENWMKV